MKMPMMRKSREKGSVLKELFVRDMHFVYHTMRRILAMVLMGISGLMLRLNVYEFLFSYEFVLIIQTTYRQLPLG